MRLIVGIFFSILFSLVSSAQFVSGTVKNERGEPLPFSSIIIKETAQGVTSNNNAQFKLNLPSGKYTVVCQHIGYEQQVKKINLEGDINIDFVLSEQKLMMEAFVVNSKGENPAYRVIRKAIAKRDYYHNQVNTFSCDIYSKDVIRLRKLPSKIFGQKVSNEDKNQMNLDSSGSGIVYLSENISKAYSKQPDKFKMEVLSSRVSGSKGFGFAFPAFIDLYANNVTVFDGGFNKRGFVSPIAEGALRFYQYKMLGTFEENGKTVYSIRVTPKRKYEPLFSGVINIVDETWSIYSTTLEVTKESQLELLDTLKITQQYVTLANNVQRIGKQVLYFNFNLFKLDVVGDFLSVYSKFNINPEFDKKHFDRIFIKYDTAVNKKPKSFWDTIRPIQLDTAEIIDYQFKDSVLKRELDSAFSKKNIDTLKKQQGKLKPFKVFLSGINRTHYTTKRKYNWGISAMVPMLQYNSAEGAVGQFNPYLNIYSKKLKANISAYTNIRYGFSNEHWNAHAGIVFKKKNSDDVNDASRTTLSISGGTRVSQYNNHVPVDPFVNTISTLFNGLNVMKIYENTFANINLVKKYENGIQLTTEVLYENRRPLSNTTSYTIKASDRSRLTANYPFEVVAIDELVRHQAFIASVGISFQPGLRYIQFPRNKMSIGSKFPVFSLKYTKGISGILGSDVDFDKWSFDVKGTQNLKLMGKLNYKFVTGGFINTKQVFVQDYRHFNSTDIRLSSNYLNGFRLMGSYLNSNAANLCSEAFIEHHFNGLLTNKIPLFKRLNWNLVSGVNAYYISENNHYQEWFLGLENIFKLFRLDLVSGYQNGKYNKTSLVLGAGGLLGGGSSNEGNKSGKNSITISF